MLDTEDVFRKQKQQQRPRDSAAAAAKVEKFHRWQDEQQSAQTVVPPGASNHWFNPVLAM